MKLRKKTMLVTALSLILLMTGIFSVGAQDTLKAAKIVELEGKVEIKKAGGEKVFSAFKDMGLTEGDTIITYEKAYVKLELDDKTELKVAENTEVTISELKSNEKEEEKTVFFLKFGKLLAKVKKILNSDSKFEIKTPTVALGVRGTRFYTEVDKNGTTTGLVLEGKVALSTYVIEKLSSGRVRQVEKSFFLQKNEIVTVSERTSLVFQNPKLYIREIEISDLDPLVVRDINEDPEGIDEKYLHFGTAQNEGTPIRDIGGTAIRDVSGTEESGTSRSTTTSDERR